MLPDRVMLNLAEVAEPDLPDALAGLGGGLVLVAPSADATAQRLVDVMAAARGAPGIRLRLIGD